MSTMSWLSGSATRGGPPSGNRLREEISRPIDATAYTGTHLLNIAATTLAFESSNEAPLSQEGIDWSADESEIREGIALAEAGLAEEAPEWPPYGGGKSGGPELNPPPK